MKQVIQPWYWAGCRRMPGSERYVEDQKILQMSFISSAASTAGELAAINDWKTWRMKGKTASTTSVLTFRASS